MYIVAIAWLYVVFMMSITEESIVAAILTFLLYGAFPLIIVLYLIGTPQRKRNRALEARKKISASEQVSSADDVTRRSAREHEK
ncbi:hypothetical protein FHW67_000189 [Herbaspirillum sp. Sphag1AN]|uniref:hypothetical protein n=1 Tax=unclassified Herbaspirillum TaxID=2624150 RepID=UPI00160A18F8|nr:MULTISPECIES: hypothetical protein [unclassified Herbaspirillum]MBB3210954.1 hypothetical protein [Herbaspirillum sp. Sphag1AN]MBB3244583.1 hypothetical protein [Herbaspirillum sp. Sphag64]